MYDTPHEEAGHTGLPHDLPPTVGNQEEIR